MQLPACSVSMRVEHAQADFFLKQIGAKTHVYGRSKNTHNWKLKTDTGMIMVASVA